jgi:hypothetical protein
MPQESTPTSDEITGSGGASPSRDMLMHRFILTLFCQKTAFACLAPALCGKTRARALCIPAGRRVCSAADRTGPGGIYHGAQSGTAYEATDMAKDGGRGQERSAQAPSIHDTGCGDCIHYCVLRED